MNHFDVAHGIWCGKARLAVRWSCVEGRPLGNPSSSGHPTWFLLPEELACGVAAQTLRLLKAVDDPGVEDAAEALKPWLPSGCACEGRHSLS